MNFGELKEKAAGLPLAPGVYIMRDKANAVIYVGKAKKLKNRVSQYFQDTATHSPKTRLMVSKIDHFDVIIAASEFEALVLECSLIKRYMPKYNILLKDDKGYPYLRLSANEAYPRISIANKIANDGALYYGPYGSRGVTQDLIETILHILRLPNCSKIFPRDIGKGRPCLNYHMKLCDGWCIEEKSKTEYLLRVEQAKQLLQGNFKQVAGQIKQQMLEASEALNFELAAGLRDRLKSVEALGQKQLVTASALADVDVIGFSQNEMKACFSVLHFRNGNLLDKEYEILPATDEKEITVASLLPQFYLNRGFAPKQILLPFPLEDSTLIEQLFAEKLGKNTKLQVPQRGDKAHLVELANVNAQEEVARITSKEERTRGTLTLLGKMTGLSAPSRIEAFDISNISGTDIVASMVVFVDGKPKKSDYKKFALKDMSGQDDYASMHQVVTRRFRHLIDGDEGYTEQPDLLLIDGGVVHAQTALAVLNELSLSIPVFGMVKDDRHRTRVLVTPDGREIGIDTQQAVYALIGNIQEETHRFAINYHRQLRSKRLRVSALDGIKGVGPKRKENLLKAFRSITAIKNASVDELQHFLPADVARNVFQHFNNREE